MIIYRDSNENATSANLHLRSSEGPSNQHPVQFQVIQEPAPGLPDVARTETDVVVIEPMQTWNEIRERRRDYVQAIVTDV